MNAKNPRTNIIRLFLPLSDQEEIKEITRTITSGFWASGEGTGKVKEFENKFSKYIGCNQVISVNSGTAALHLALSVSNVSKKEVLVPSLTFASTAHAAVYNNAKPKFVDIDESTLCIDIDDLEKKITKNTKVVMPVHFGGYPCDLNSIKKIKNDYGLCVVEDAAHACGAKFANKKIGTHNELVCFSFHPVKNLAMPIGGAIAVNGKKEKTKLLKSLRWCGITDRKDGIYDIKQVGWNYYMNEISAAIGIIQLKRLERMNRHRKQIAREYSRRLNVEHKMPFSQECSYHLYWIRVKNRKEFMNKMMNRGIETGIHYKPVHLMKYYSNSGRLENCEKIWRELVSLPMHANLSKYDVEKIITKTNEFAR